MIYYVYPLYLSISFNYYLYVNILTSDQIPVNHCGQLSFWQASLFSGFKSGQLFSNTLNVKAALTLLIMCVVQYKYLSMVNNW